MHSRKKSVGVVYVATNDVISHYAKTIKGIDHVCKIGMSYVGIDQSHGRNSSAQNPFTRNEFVFTIETTLAHLVEKEAHRTLRSKRINDGAGTEWFSCSTNEAIMVVTNAHRVVSTLKHDPRSEDPDEWLAAIGEQVGSILHFKRKPIKKKDNTEQKKKRKFKKRGNTQKEKLQPFRFDAIKLGQGWK